MSDAGRMFARGVDVVLDRTVGPGYSRWGHTLRRRLPGWPADPAPEAMTGRAAAVTGASSGLGTAIADGFAALGATVHLVVRDTAKGERVRGELSAKYPKAELHVWRCDVSDLDDVTRFAVEFGTQPLDVLVHNAGVLPPERTVTAQGHELALATHVLGPLRMTELLRPSLRAAHESRVVLVSSGGMYAQKLPEDPEYASGEYAGATAYARTKRMQVALTQPLSRRWTTDGISVHSMHPGWADTPGVATSLPGFHKVTRPLLRDTAQGADTVVWLAAADPAPPSGRFWHDRQPRPEHLVPWTRHSASEAEDLLAWCVREARIDAGTPD